MTLGHLRITIRHFLGRGVQGVVVAGSTGRVAVAPVCRQSAKIGPRIRSRPAKLGCGLSRENSHQRFPAAHCRAFGGQASAPRVPTATVPAMGSVAFGAGAGKSEEPLGTMPVTLIADLAGLSARR
jgi:hypothetical protein